jgi:two-component system chemotaxis response regulator CheY
LVATPRILLVEDDPGIRESITDCLAFEGYEVAGAANGEEGLRYLGLAPRPALIILDLIMPVMNGAQFLERLRQDEELASIPVVVMTAAMAAGSSAVSADGRLAKPFELAELLQVVQRFAGPAASPARPQG